jgi:hypothetical protein
MGLISDFLSGENKRREEAARKAVGIDEDYEQRLFLATHPDMRSEDEEYDDDEYDEDEDYNEDDEYEEECDEESDELSDTAIICGAIIGAKILRRGEELGLINLDNL